MNIDELHTHVLSAMAREQLNVVMHHQGVVTQDEVTNAVINGDTIDLWIKTTEIVMYTEDGLYVAAVLINGRPAEQRTYLLGDDPIQAWGECLSQCRAWTKQYGCRGVIWLNEPPILY